MGECAVRRLFYGPGREKSRRLMRECVSQTFDRIALWQSKLSRVASLRYPHTCVSKQRPRRRWERERRHKFGTTYTYIPTHPMQRVLISAAVNYF